MFQLIDPTTGALTQAKGNLGRFTLSPPESGGVITPDDVVIYDPPIMAWVGDTGPVNVNVVPYGRDGDKQVTYPLMFGMSIPVLCRQVLFTGTTAIRLYRGYDRDYALIQIQAPTGPRSDTTSITTDTTTITADSY